MVERSSSTAPMCRAAAPTAPRRTRSPSCTATPTSRRGCSRTARPTSCRRSSASSPRARAPIARPPTRSWRLTRRCDRELRPEHHLMLHRPAESGNAAVLETMLACGFETGREGQGQRHAASPRGDGRPRRCGARAPGARRRRRRALDGMFSAPPLVWAVEGRSNTRHRGADHVGVARLLIAAGSPLEWTPPEGAPGPERTLEGLSELRRDATNGASA